MSEALDPHLRDVLDEVNHDEPRWAVVRIHLRVERELWRIAREQLPRPEFLPQKSSWAALLRWGTAADLVGDDLFVPLMKLNKLRNEIAHEVEAAISTEKMTALVNTCPAYFVAYKFEDPLGAFRAAIGQLYLAVRNTRSGDGEVAKRPDA